MLPTIRYPAVFHPETVGFSVSFPDVEGCFTQGDTLAEAEAMAQEALALALEDRPAFPSPSAPADIPLEEGDRIVTIPFYSRA